ncbi:hypothetical protein HMPREF3156_00836 [Neisseria sp. HMSC06F02]|nr:hypothetical protein HMPREF3156_00836 [Neisseria sp. HMSC06F02]
MFLFCKSIENLFYHSVCIFKTLQQTAGISNKPKFQIYGNAKNRSCLYD